MKTNKKYFAIIIVALLLISTFAVVCQAAVSATIPEYYYDIKDGWHDLYTIDGTSADGSLYCEYSNGLFTAPKVMSIVNGSGDLNYVGLDLYMWASDGDRFEDYDTADSSLELTVQAGFWDSITSTWHYGQVYANDGTKATAQVFGE